ncbi:hypothetical protein ZHAS_00014093 [Anopheles sinensis]|uniref:Uncharacterized protein n=1 Tax=Anopheles sinensis TaxID=74873 RepID=A0A084W7C0_ANOSI|nr:hypothetical protein ZHAS_00014093 [Anopheles sinensis]
MRNGRLITGAAGSGNRPPPNKVSSVALRYATGQEFSGHQMRRLAAQLDISYRMPASHRIP